MAQAVAYELEKALFIEWLKLGTKEIRVAKGEPATIVEYAERPTSPSRSQLQAWKKEPEVLRAVMDSGSSMYTVDEVNRVKRAILAKALEANVPAATLVFKLAGVAMSGSGAEAPADPKATPFADMTAEQLAAAYAQVSDDDDG